ncbi:hypothetical protein [Algicola sagamiensis]|uniref:hypothetical protein n=1 Tax=Algicola sagamiensis TaxID=163869 RepID=UPI000362CE7F|nr:hypothetical protein [Algicola sagamiensis]
MTSELSKEELVEYIAALEYMLAQAMALAVRHDKDPEGSLVSMQASFSDVAARKGVFAGMDNMGYQAAERIYTSVKSSL